MTHFRSRYKAKGYLRWRFRAGRQQPLARLMSLAAARVRRPSTAAWRHAWLLPELAQPTVQALRVGDYLVGADWDAQLQGHPDIRY